MPDGHIEELSETVGTSSQDGESDGGYPTLGNGRPAGRPSNPAVDREINKHRQPSHSQHDRKSSMSSNATASNSTVNSALYGGQAGSSRAASNAHLQPNAYMNPSAAMSSSNPKDSFLNYFFGGASLAGGSLVNNGGSGRDRNTNLPDLGGSRENPLMGRKGHEGAAAAYDMKSLDKHSTLR